MGCWNGTCEINYKKEYLDENIVDENFDKSEILKENIYIY